MADFNESKDNPLQKDFVDKLPKGEETCVYKFCDKIAVFSDGKIAEYGNHDKLVSIANGIYAKMFEAQAQYYR